MISSTVFIGIHGSVVALDRATGQELWSTDLKGGQFVSVLLDGSRVLASTKGEVFCLDAATGQILWHNSMPGMGWGIVSMATINGTSSPTAEAEQKHRDDDQAATTAAIVSSPSA
jgi:outer membrane protein assembly factor BamB